MNAPRRTATQAVAILLILTIATLAQDSMAAEPPVADGGSSRYAATDPVTLNGTRSYDPDQSGPLSYLWVQVSGPPVTVSDQDTATPTISDFVQTAEIQECVFELTVSAEEMQSSSALTSVFIVPEFGTSTLELFNDRFDPDKPTIIYFGGGDCSTGYTSLIEGARLPFQSEGWLTKANIIWYPHSYFPDGGPQRTYYKYGDMLIVYLSSVAPEYAQLIQTSGWSTGGQPAIDVGIRLNETYQDPRYAVNHVSFLDATPYCRDYSESIPRYLASGVDGEQCWIDNYVASMWENYPLGEQPSFPFFQNGVLTTVFDGYENWAIWFPQHALGNDWIGESLHTPRAMLFNGGIAAGAYFSVVGPGKNLQLASTPKRQIYRFWWTKQFEDRLQMADEPTFPGRLPEPVTLTTRSCTDDASGGGMEGVVLSCRGSENAVGYELLLGSEPHRVAHYAVASDTPDPPDVIVTTLPYEETWWTVRVRDEFGSTIYADPRLLNAFVLSRPVENATTGVRYAYVQDAVDDASLGDEIVLEQGTYRESLTLQRASLTLRSIDPEDAEVIANTIISGDRGGPVVTLSPDNDEITTLKGLTVTGGTVAVLCGGASVTFQKCTMDSSGPTTVETWYGSSVDLVDCTVTGEVADGYDPTLVAHWKLDETEGEVASDSVGYYDAELWQDATWAETEGRLGGALQLEGTYGYVIAPPVVNPAEGAFSVFAWVKGGAPGQVVIAQSDGADWLLADPSEGKLMTALLPPQSRSAPSVPLISDHVLTDGQWHHIGLVWDGIHRMLYLDEVAVAEDMMPSVIEANSYLFIGCGVKKPLGTYWSGLIDDVRIYGRAVRP